MASKTDETLTDYTFKTTVTGFQPLGGNSGTDMNRTLTSSIDRAVFPQLQPILCQVFLVLLDSRTSDSEPYVQNIKSKQYKEVKKVKVYKLYKTKLYTFYKKYMYK